MKKVIDIVKPVCPNWDQHYQIRRWLRSLPSLGWMDGDVSILVIPDWKDPCNTRIITDGLNSPINTKNILESDDIGASLLSDVEFDRAFRPRHTHCRCALVLTF